MKLWYQGMSRQTGWGAYPAVLRSILDTVKDPGTEIHVAGIHVMGGRFVSKKCAYAPPPPDQIETFRKYYGADIYPSVKAP